MKTAAAPIAQVPIVDAPERELFVHEYLNPGKPVILRGLMKNWPARQLWNVDYFRDRLGSKEVVVQVAPDGVFGLDPDEGGPRFQPRYMPFREYLDKLSGPQIPGERYYLQRLSIPHMLPELLSDFTLPPYVAQSKVYLTNLWFGPAGNVTKLHYDVPNNFLAQVCGRKRFVLFPPSDTPGLYPCRSKAYNMSRVDVDRPDLNAFPKFRDTTRYECTLDAGDMIFLPSFWWHQVYSLDLGISVNFWWIPKIRQLFVPQIRDTIVDTTKEGWRFLIHKSGSTFERRA